MDNHLLLPDQEQSFKCVFSIGFNVILNIFFYFNLTGLNCYRNVTCTSEVKTNICSKREARTMPHLS